jgi:hypothetical protein
MGRRQPAGAGKVAARAKKVPAVRPRLLSVAPAKDRSVRVRSGAGAGEARNPQKAPLAPQAASARPGLRRGNARAAIALITAPLAAGNGYRHLWVGNTGMGKTWGARALVAEPGQLTLIHDDSKAAPEYPGVRYFANVADLKSQPADDVRGLTAVGFRGDPYQAITCEVEEVSAWALELARGGTPVRLVVDETSRAVSDTGKTLLAPSLRLCATVGRTMGLSISAGAQEIIFMPRALLAQASSIALFRVESADVNYLRERLAWDPELLAAAAQLDVGDFLIRQPATRWDRTIYRF